MFFMFLCHLQSSILPSALSSYSAVSESSALATPWTMLVAVTAVIIPTPMPCTAPATVAAPAPPMAALCMTANALPAATFPMPAWITAANVPRYCQFLRLAGILWHYACILTCNRTSSRPPTSCHDRASNGHGSSDETQADSANEDTTCGCRIGRSELASLMDFTLDV